MKSLMVVFAGCVLIAVVSVAQTPQPGQTTANTGTLAAPAQRQATVVRRVKPAKRQMVNRRSPMPAPTMANVPNAVNQNTGTTAVTKNHAAYSEALRRYRHERHDRFWWKHHYTIIVLVGGGYYYWDAGYWCPAWGYDTGYESYDYDGPIYTYGNLLPDQVIANVQRALKQLGYYTGEITGSLGAATRAAIAAYQQDNGLDVTGAIDPATVAALGLN